jgi:hypothetical protein
MSNVRLSRLDIGLWTLDFGQSIQYPRINGVTSDCATAVLI